MDNTGYEPDSAYSNNNIKAKPAMTESEKKVERRAIYKNLFVMSGAFLCLFTAFESMSKLQSSINKVTGVASNTTIYAALIVSCMFVPPILIKKLKVKWTLIISAFAYSLYMAAQFYPAYYTLIPTAIVLGIGAAPLWSAKCTYLTQIANRMAALNGEDSGPWVVKFFGIFFFFFQCNAIIGNVISTSVLSSDSDVTADKTDAELSKCGINFCIAEKTNETAETAETADVLSATTRYSLAGVYLVFSLLAALLLAFFLDPLTRFGEDERGSDQEKLGGVQLLMATARQMKDKKQMLIIPLTIWSGVEQGFFGGDFVAGYVTCAFGAHYVGRVLICFGVLDSLSSAGFGYLIKLVGRVPIFLLGAAINYGVLIALFNWAPHPDSIAVVFVLAALWGIGDAIWQTQINALYGNLFPSKEEAAFSNYRLWESLGFVIAFAAQTAGVCMYSKLILVTVVLSVGMVGYLIVELLVRHENRV